MKPDYLFYIFSYIDHQECIAYHLDHCNIEIEPKASRFFSFCHIARQ